MVRRGLRVALPGLASIWESQLSQDRFISELDSDHVDTLYQTNGQDGPLLAYVKWKATEQFLLSRDELSDPALPSLPVTSQANYVCAYEITATADPTWRGLGRRLLTETLEGWQRTYDKTVFCTYSPKRGLTSALRRLAEARQYNLPALEVFAHRAGAAASRHIEQWTARLGQPLEIFIRREIVPVPDPQIMSHLTGLSDYYGRDVIDGVVAAIGIAYNFVLRAHSGLPVCGPAAFHRALELNIGGNIPPARPTAPMLSGWLTIGAIAMIHKDGNSAPDCSKSNSPAVPSKPPTPISSSSWLDHASGRCQSVPG